jgi:hypothetical protein
MSLGIELTQLETSIMETVDSLKERGFVKFLHELAMNNERYVSHHRRNRKHESLCCIRNELC